MAPSPAPAPSAYLGGLWATELVETVDLLASPDALDRGWWAVCATFEGAITGYRFGSVEPAPLPAPASPWPGVPGPWRSSMSRADYERGVAEIRERVARGLVYQANLCRLLTAELGDDAGQVVPDDGGSGRHGRKTGDEASSGDESTGRHGRTARDDEHAGHDDAGSGGLGDDGSAFSPLALAAVLAAGNPARYQGVLHTGREWIVSASPELFLSRDGDRLVSAPIKGTAAPGEPFAAKDTPENIMICDLVRNDLGRVALTGTVRVESLLAREELPGLAHLVSTVSARLKPGASWREIFAALLPPGSVSGAPKHTALGTIRDLEPVPRGPYCGAIGYVDGDRRRAELAVGIRTFFTSGGMRRLHFGTGAGITVLSDPEAEWAETELKAARLIALASAPSHAVR